MNNNKLGQMKTYLREGGFTYRSQKPLFHGDIQVNEDNEHSIRLQRKKKETYLLLDSIYDKCKKFYFNVDLQTTSYHYFNDLESQIEYQRAVTLDRAFNIVCIVDGKSATNSILHAKENIKKICEVCHIFNHLINDKKYTLLRKIDATASLKDLESIFTSIKDDFVAEVEKELLTHAYCNLELIKE